MKTVLPHRKTREEAAAIMEAQADKMFSMQGSVTISDQRREWVGETLHVSCVAKYGFININIACKVLVDDACVVIETEVPAFVKTFVGEDKIEAGLRSKLGPLLV